MPAVRKFSSPVQADTGLVVRCPVCLHQGTLKPFPGVTDAQIDVSDTRYHGFGVRHCPNPTCLAIIFVDYAATQVVASWPPEQLDFDGTGLPATVLNAMTEAIACHSVKAYVAAGMMVRKTLEAICADQGGTGSTLQQRLQALRNRVVLPEPLFVAMDELRLLGNDAAHIESRDFDRVGKEEVEAGILLAKEVLKAVYQYQSLIGALAALKKQRDSDETPTDS
jgi:hypothetical protein